MIAGRTHSGMKPLAAAIGLLLALASSQALPQPSAGGSGPDAITPAAERAIGRGLTWLAGRQHDDGSFGSGPYYGNVAITALAGMAFLADGSTPDRGPHGRRISLAIDYLLASALPSGFINAPRGAGHGPMYGHGFATLFLAECHGMSQRPELRETLSKAVKLIVNAQNKGGGWRYYPQRSDADISVTVCQAMALRAARNAGLHVPKEIMDRSVEYVKRCQNADGGFRYQLEPGESAFPRSAAALVALTSAGVYEGQELQRGIQYLVQFLPKPGVVQREVYYEYGHYYAVQVMWQIGDKTWRQWYPAIRDDLLARQRENGSWAAPTAIDVDYTTAMSLIVLELPNDLLPIFQR